MSDLTKIKKARVFEGPGYTDGSHPASGNLILMNDGRAFFGGDLYQSQNYLGKEKAVEAPKFAVPGLSAFSAGDRVRITSDIFDDGIAHSIPVGSTGVVTNISSFVNVTVDQIPDSGTWPYYADEIELLPPAPKFKVGDKIVVQKHQWNIDYQAVSGPVIGKVVNVSTYEGVPSYAVQHANKWGVTAAIWTDRPEADNLVAAPEFKYAVGDRVTVTDFFTENAPRQGTVVGITPLLDDGNLHAFPYQVNKGGPSGYPGWSTSESHLSDPAPEPTHKYPEGLYQDPGKPEIKVYVHHEDKPGRYRVTYLGEVLRDGGAVLNRNMSDLIVGFYTLVTPA